MGCICYIIAEGFFLYYHFSLVRLRTIRLSARAGAHIECRCSRSCAEDVTITDVIIKTPDRKWKTGVVNDVRSGSNRLRILVIFEKSSQLRSDAGRSELGFGPGRGQSSCGLRNAPRVSGVRWNGQHSKNCVSLSPRVEKTKLKKSINVSYLNKRKSSVFRDSYAYEHFTYLYISHIRIMAIQHIYFETVLNDFVFK